MRRAARLTTLVVAAALLGACAVGTDHNVRVIGDDKVPFNLLEKTAPTLVPNARTPVTETVGLCFIRDGRLAVVGRPLDAPVTLDAVVAALAEVRDDSGARTAVGPQPLVNSVHLQGGVVRVDLAPSLATLGAADQILAVAQLVCTLTARPGIGQVSFTLDGAAIDVPRGDGSLTPGPVSRDEYANLFASTTTR